MCKLQYKYLIMKVLAKGQTGHNNVYTQLVSHASCISAYILIENPKTFNFKVVTSKNRREARCAPGADD
jgi:hypothetical protein